MRTVYVLSIGAALLTLSGCASLRRHEAAGLEQLLAAAGFQPQSAEGPELESLPPLKVVSRNLDGAARYTVSDPYKCRCLYVGGAKEYSAYQRAVMQQQEAAWERLRADQDRMISEQGSHWHAR